MRDPFEVLGVRPGDDIDTIRAAYHAKAKLCHPDLVPEEEKQAAQDKIVELNLAYEAVLRIVVPYQTQEKQAADGGPHCDLTPEQAKQLARKMLSQDRPRSALRELTRTAARDAEWHHIRSQALLAVGEFVESHGEACEAVRLEPDNLEFRCMALDAAIALKKSQTFTGRLCARFRRKKLV